jgi:hypothetical protein
MRLMDRFPEEKDSELLKAKIALYSQHIFLWVPFRDVIGTYIELNKALLAAGAIDGGMLASAMLSMYAYLDTSLSLMAL